MAEKDVLSQEEIDALLESVEENPEGGASEASANFSEPNADVKSAEEFANPPDGSTKEAAKPSGDELITGLNFNSADRAVKVQLPVLDKIYDRMLRLFTADIYNLTANDFEIKQEPLLVIKHKEFMMSLPNPSLMSIYKFKPLRGKGIVLFDSTFIYDLVDYYFGGSSQFFAQKDRTDYTATELRVMDVVVKKLIDNLTYAWRPIISLDITKFNDETNPQLVNIAEPEEILLVGRFHLNFGKESGSFYLIIPYSMVEPIKQQLELGASRQDDEIDPNWINSLKEELMEVELLISSSMARATTTLGQVMAWQVGDFIPLEMADEVTLDIEGTPSFTAATGNMGEKRALQIIKRIEYY